MCEASNKAYRATPVSKSIELDVFFPPKDLKMIVRRPDSAGIFDRTQEYEDRKHLLSLNRKPVRDEKVIP